VTFTLTRSGVTATAVTVDYETTNGTASAPTDYLSATGTLSYATGETTKTIDVTVNGDRALEHKESFFVDLLTPSVGAAIDTGQATGIITNDDTRTTLKITKRAGRIRAFGRLSPVRKGEHMVVKLFRKKNGVWVRLRTKRPTLSGATNLNGDGFTDSKYSTRFPRPRPGSCMVTAVYPGDPSFGSSTAVKRFRC
jgi:Calx-beta domain